MATGSSVSWLYQCKYSSCDTAKSLKASNESSQMPFRIECTLIEKFKFNRKNVNLIEKKDDNLIWKPPKLLLLQSAILNICRICACTLFCDSTYYHYIITI